jgi:hypothetical protein
MFLKDKDLFKDVKKVKLSELLPNYRFPPGFDHAVVDVNNNILNFCSERYNLIPNHLILLPLEAYFKINKIDFIRKGKIINGSKFYVDYIIKTRKDVGSVTGVFPKISIINSYDGVSGGKVELGLHRLACSTTLAIPEKNCKNYFKHASPKSHEVNIHDKVIKIIAEARNFIDTCQDDISHYLDLTNVKANKKNISTIGKRIGLSKKVIEAAEERYELEVDSGIEYLNEYNEMVTHVGSGKNLFTIYNALNYGIYNTNLKELPERKMEKSKTLINSILSLV